MKLITKALAKKLPAIGSTSVLPADQVKVPVKLFNPSGAGTWYLTEYDPKTKECFGFAHILEGELGYFSLTELENFKGRFGLGIERDINWDPNTTLRQVMENYR